MGVVYREAVSRYTVRVLRKESEVDSANASKKKGGGGGGGGHSSSSTLQNGYYE